MVAPPAVPVIRIAAGGPAHRRAGEAVGLVVAEAVAAPRAALAVADWVVGVAGRPARRGDAGEAIEPVVAKGEALVLRLTADSPLSPLRVRCAQPSENAIPEGTALPPPPH